MKKFYILGALILSVNSLLAQNFSYPIEQHWNSWVQNENYESYQIDINTPSPEAIHYQWTLVSNTFPAAWSYSLCDYGNCAVGVPGSGSMTPISLTEAQNGTIGWFKMNLTVGQNPGQGSVLIYVYDSNDPNRGDTVSWNVTWDPASASLDVVTKSAVKMYPNPTTSKLNFEANGNYSGVIHNSLGQQVKAFGTNEKTIDVSELNKGVYFVTVYDGTKSVFVERLIVK